MTMEIIVIVKLQNGLRLTYDCLGKSFGIKINGIQGTLLTPSLPPDLTKDSFSYCWPFLVQPKSHIKFSEDIIWGKPHTGTNDGSTLERFMIQFEYKNDLEFDQINHKIKDGIGSWINRFRENLFGFGHNIDSPGIKVKNSWQYDYDFYYTSKEAEKTISIFIKDPDEVYIYIEEPINMNEFEQTLAKTSENKRLILEYQLLKDANQSLLNDNYRKSVLDCATALELCLTNVLKKDLQIKGDLLDKILLMNNSITKKRGLMKYTKHILPKHNYEKDIEGLRNRAIHIGKTPTENEAKKAYEIVKEVVDILTIEKFE